MPFVKQTDLKDQPASRNATDTIFVGRTKELDFFQEHILKPEDPTYNIISVFGQGWVGKTELLHQFIKKASLPEYKDYCLIALVNERQSTVDKMMETFANQLHIEGV